MNSRSLLSRLPATQPIDDATSSFLRSAADDLQRQLGRTAVVDQVTVERLRRGVMLVATVQIGARNMEIRGRGANLVAAYSDLSLAVPASVLAAAFSEVLEG